MNDGITPTLHAGDAARKLTVRVRPDLIGLIRQQCEITRETQQDFVSRVLSEYCQQATSAPHQPEKIDAASEAGAQESKPSLADKKYDSVKAQFGE
ncbi:hypothetical protein PQR14_36095 [Paraburkholderia bryophila]|uniref:hypothetical protein n=1 Tax=Paraburkholderia bryophila TaxID=420952 RepID=UPI0038BB9E21